LLLELGLIITDNHCRKVCGCLFYVSLFIFSVKDVNNIETLSTSTKAKITLSNNKDLTNNPKVLKNKKIKISAYPAKLLQNS
jgi:hypothetical protein